MDYTGTPMYHDVTMMLWTLGAALVAVIIIYLTNDRGHDDEDD